MPSRLLSAACVLALCLMAATLQAQDVHDHRLFICAENGLETGSTGCQLLGKKNITQFGAGPLYWHLNKLTKEMPMSFDAGEYGLIVKDKNDVWLYSIGPKDTPPKEGTHVASVGPLPMVSAKSYELVAYHVVMPAQQYTMVHTHPGPEAWYILSGEQCLETPAGTMKGHTGEGMVAPPNTPMRLTNNGQTNREALFIVIHDAAQPWTIRTDAWQPTGSCDTTPH